MCEALRVPGVFERPSAEQRPHLGVGKLGAVPQHRPKALDMIAKSAQVPSCHAESAWPGATVLAPSRFHSDGTQMSFMSILAS